MRISSTRVGSVAGALVLLIQGLAMVPANAAQPNASMAWTQTDLSMSAYLGTVADAQAEFTFSGSFTKPGIKIVGALAGAVSVDLGAIRVTSPGHAVAPIHVEMPVTPQTDYNANLQWTVDGRPQPKPLHLIVTSKTLDPHVIPDSIGFPAPSRITSFAGSSVITDQLVVRIAAEDPTPDQTIKTVAANIGGQVVSVVRSINRYEIQIPGASISKITSLLNKVATYPGVAAATVDALASGSGYTNDPIWQPSPSSHRDENWNLQQIDAPAAWDSSTGQGVDVAEIDSGIYASHPDLAFNLKYDEEAQNSNLSHGTHTAGTACAQGNNGLGMVGVAWGCNLSMYGVYFDSYNNVDLTDVYHRMDEINSLPPLINGAHISGKTSPRVVNISIGNETKFDCTGSLTPDQVVQFSYIAEAGAEMTAHLKQRQDILWVFSAGNSGYDSSCSAFGDLGKTGSLPNVISVAASNADGTLRGASVHGRGVTVAAPGTDVYSTVPPDCSQKWWTGLCDVAAYGFKSGTSMAAPHVTGTAALAFGANTALTAAQAKQCLVDGAKAGGKLLPGQPTYVINARKTVDCAQGLLRPATAVEDLFTDGNSGFALLNSGAYTAWGFNQAGELGLGNTSDQEPPTALNGLSGVKSIVEQYGTTFAITNDGTVQAWGSNNRGQLGDGTRIDKHAPQPIPGLTDVKDIYVDYPLSGRGVTTVYAIKTDGSVMAWGDNPSRLLINGLSDSSVLTPFPVVGLNGVTQIRSNDFTAWALRTDGSVVSWGDNYDGQYGNPLYFGPGTSAPQVSQITGVVSIEPGWHNIIALKADGTVWGWGRDGTAGLLHGWNTSTPISLGLSDVKAIYVQPGGGATGFALKNDGTAWAWGWNCSNEAGVGVIGNCVQGGSAAGNVIWTPTQIPNLSSVTQLGPGMALTADGTVWAWSSPLLWSQGSTAGPSEVPMKVQGIPAVVKIFATPSSSWALGANGALYGWGNSNMLSPNTTLNPTCMVGCTSQ